MFPWKQASLSVKKLPQYHIKSLNSDNISVHTNIRKCNCDILHDLCSFQIYFREKNIISVKKRYLEYLGVKRNISNRLSVVFSRTLASAGKELKDNFLKALAEREEANRSGKMTSVIFIRDHNTLGQEVSGYIDYAHRLKTQDFEPYFSGKKRLMPGRSDLCYYNWKTQVSTSNSSPNFEVIYDDPNGLLFKNKRDKKILNVDPLVGLCCYCSGTSLKTHVVVLVAQVTNLPRTHIILFV
uniref:Cilia- and flagella-associated protein 299 n=1 Tax=Sander lucioperca TaxID=283035 RepID=A0A8D0CTV4_SANLU